MQTEKEDLTPGWQISRRANDLRGRYAALDDRLDRLDAVLDARTTRTLTAP